MKVEDVYQFFGSAINVAQALGITRGSVHKWVRKGVVPLDKQKQIEILTKGKLIAKKVSDKPTDLPTYLPSFRYYDKKYGICKVESMHFKEGKLPKITYLVKNKHLKSLSVVTTKNLMQGVDFVDSEGKMVYEGDIFQLSSGTKFTFEKIEMAHKLKRLGKFKIIGNIFEE